MDYGHEELKIIRILASSGEVFMSLWRKYLLAVSDGVDV